MLPCSKAWSGNLCLLSFAEQKKESEENWQQLSIQEHMQHYLDAGVDKKEAMKKVAKDRGVSKRDIYQALLDEE